MGDWDSGMSAGCTAAGSHKAVGEAIGGPEAETFIWAYHQLNSRPMGVGFRRVRPSVKNGSQSA